MSNNGPLGYIFEAHGLTPNSDSYRGWTIHYDPPPIPARSFDWCATGPNFDASWEEDGYVSNGEQVFAGTRAELIAEIDAWFEAQPPETIEGWKLQCGEARNALDRIYGALKAGDKPDEERLLAIEVIVTTALTAPQGPSHE